MKTLKDMLTEARQVVPEEGPAEVARRLAAGEKVVVIDVRDPDEFRDGHLEAATNISRGFLEFRVGTAVSDPSTPIVLYCQTGLRSMLAAKALKDLGYSTVINLQGGYQKWVQSGMAVVKETPLTTDQIQRYSRHFLLPQVGDKGQRKLLRSKVLLIGAGGLGSPTAFYLAAAGVGTLALMDGDVVDITNLQRQLRHPGSSPPDARPASRACSQEWLERFRRLRPSSSCSGSANRCSAASSPTTRSACASARSGCVAIPSARCAGPRRRSLISRSTGTAPAPPARLHRRVTARALRRESLPRRAADREAPRQAPPGARSAAGPLVRRGAAPLRLSPRRHRRPRALARAGDRVDGSSFAGEHDERIVTAQRAQHPVAVDPEHRREIVAAGLVLHDDPCGKHVEHHRYPQRAAIGDDGRHLGREGIGPHELAPPPSATPRKLRLSSP